MLRAAGRWAVPPEAGRVERSQAADRKCAIATSRPRQAGVLPGRDGRGTWAACTPAHPSLELSLL